MTPPAKDVLGAALVVSIVAAAAGWLHPAVSLALLAAWIVAVNHNFRRKMRRLV